MEKTDYNIWQIFAGIGLFLFGMQLLEVAISNLAGRSFKLFLKNQTSHPIKAILAGILVTALLQSSSVVNLLVLAFVGARILSLKNAMAIILGSNLGSTVYNWIVVYLGFKFDIQTFAFPIMAVGAVGLILFQDNKRIMHWTRLAFGISLLFVGLSNIKSGVETAVTRFDFSGFAQYGNFVFIIIGFVLTAIVQSSATTVVITMAALNAGVLTFESAACLVAGSESGTAIKTVIGSFGNVADKKRLALGNMLLNLTSTLVAYIFLSQLIILIRDWMGIQDPLVALVSFQSTINFIGILIFYPFLSTFSKWLSKRFINDNEKITVYLNKLLLNESEEAIKAVQKEGIRLIHNIIYLNKQAFEITNSSTESANVNDVIIPQTVGKSYSESYELVKHLNGEIIDFNLELQNHDLNSEDKIKIQKIFEMLNNTMASAKTVKDIRHNIKDFRDSADDTMHGFFLQIRKSEQPFYSKIEFLLASETTEIILELEDILSQTKILHDENIKQIYGLSIEHKLQDIELATLLNVFGAIQSSHESLISAIKDLIQLRKKV